MGTYYDTEGTERYLACNHPVDYCPCSEEEMTEAEVGAIRAAIQHLQTERDVLSDEKQVAAEDVQQFPFAFPLYGPVPDSGLWQDHLRTPVNEAAAGKYDAAVARAKSLADRYEANGVTTRALEALLA